MEESTSITVNPYQSPETLAAPEKTLATQGALTENMLIYLKEASPWLKFIGVVGFISAGLTALWALFSFTPFMWNIWDDLNVFAFFEVGMAVLFLGGAALIFLPSLFLYRFGDRIRNYLLTGADDDLEQAFRNNKSFWKFTGIMCIIYLAFIPVMFIGLIILAIGAALG